MPFTTGQYLTKNDLDSQEDAHTLGYGVLNGLKVIPEAPPSMDIEVEIGKAYVADTLVNKVAVTTLTVTAADPTNPRKDIVVCNSVGTLSIVAGTPEAALPIGNVGIYTLNPEPPSIPATSIILGEIWVPAAATEITGSEIYDKRVSIADFLAHASRHQDGGADEIDSALALAAMANLTTGKIWQGNANRPAEVDPPVIPSGLIAMWHGTIANIPGGWLICDGNGGTPNLLAKFVEGVASAVTNPGAGGGEASHTLITNEIPSHNHAILTDTGGTEASTSVIGQTSRNVTRRDINSKSTGGGAAHENRPPFYDIAFIMKT